MSNNKEYSELEKYLVNGAVKALGITKKAAKLRVKAIVKSGILSKFGTPDTVPFQIAVDAAMMIPQLGEKED